MDDIRLWMYSVRLGWRWVDGGLKYSTEWRTEERMAGMTGLQKTVEVIKHMMNSICDFLVLTMESGDDFPGGRLPTLDLNIWVGDQVHLLREADGKFNGNPEEIGYAREHESVHPHSGGD